MIKTWNIRVGLLGAANEKESIGSHALRNVVRVAASGREIDTQLRNCA